MDIFDTLKSYYSGLLVCGVLLLASACVFACIDFGKNTVGVTDYVWRALSVTCFIVGSILLVGLFVFTMYKRCSKSMPYERLNQTDIELTAR